MGHRTLRVEDYGKIAATFVDVRTEQAVRIIPRLDVRQRAAAYAPGETRRYFAQLQGYQVMPDEELLAIQPVQLIRPAAEIVSRPGVRVDCAVCGEEIVNEREVLVDGRALCRACAYGGYYASGMTMPGIVMPAVELPATPCLLCHTMHERRHHGPSPNPAPVRLFTVRMWPDDLGEGRSSGGKAARIAQTPLPTV